MRGIPLVTTVSAGALAVFMLSASRSAVADQSQATRDKIPITTSSAQARELYLKGRDLSEKLRATDARKFFEEAVAQDKEFALGYVGLAISSGTAKEFIDATTHAASLASRVSEGERHMILGLEAGMKGNPAGQETHYIELVRLFPNDERAHNLLGNVYFGRQDYRAAVEQYSKANAIDPSFSAPYNQLGYAYRFLERYDDAEKAFKKYIELIPNDPNPYDSYAELLMKIGRFDESIRNYEKALSIDPNFVASYIGIGNDHLCMGHPDQARATFAKLARAARTTGERRLAHFWTSAAYVHEGATDKAVDEIRQAYALAEAEKDAASMSGDLNQMGDILREAGRPDEALAKYAESVTVMNKAEVPEDVKEATRRNNVFEEGRVAVAKHDLVTAKAKAAEYAKQIMLKKVPFEMRQQHELSALIALADKDYAKAVQAFKLANQQDPRVLYLTALALQGSGNAQEAHAFATKAANFNGLNFNYAYVRIEARKLSST